MKENLKPCHDCGRPTNGRTDYPITGHFCPECAEAWREADAETFRQWTADDCPDDDGPGPVETGIRDDHGQPM
jgi:recombinational DNA repair protein (RecF pathway)